MVWSVLCYTPARPLPRCAGGGRAGPPANERNHRYELIRYWHAKLSEPIEEICTLEISFSLFKTYQDRKCSILYK
jgi:hypothetical protein